MQSLIEKFKLIIERKEFDRINQEFTLEERENFIKLIYTDDTLLSSLQEDKVFFKIKFFTEAEAKEKIHNFTSINLDNMFYLMSLSDNDKKIIIDKCLNASNFAEFDSDKLECFEIIICSLDSDYFKLKYVDFNFGNYRFNIDIYSSISDEAIRKQSFSNMISSLGSFEEKINFINSCFFSISSEKNYLVESVISQLEIAGNLKKIANFINNEMFVYSDKVFVTNILMNKISFDEKLELLSYLEDRIFYNYRGYLFMSKNIPVEELDKKLKLELNYVNDIIFENYLNLILKLDFNIDDLINELQNRNLLINQSFMTANINLLLEYFSKKTNIDINRLKQFYDLFGVKFIPYIQNEKIKSLLNSSDYYKIVELLNCSKLNSQNFNTIFNLLVQIEFGKKNGEIFDFYNQLTQEIDEEKYKKITKLIAANLNIDSLLKHPLFIKYIQQKKYTLDYCYNNIEEIINTLIKENIESFGTDYNKNICEIINIICVNHIATKRELFLKEKMENMDDVLNMPKFPVKDKVVAKVISQLSSEELINLFRLINIETLTDEQKFLLLNQEMLLECIKFKKNPQGYQENLSIITKKDLLSRYLKTFNKLTEILFNNKLLSDYITENEMQSYIPIELNEFAIQVLINIEYYNRGNNILFGENFEELKEIIKTYSFLGISDIFGKYIESLGLVVDSDTISTLIGYYPLISKKINEIKVEREKKNDNRPISFKDYIEISNFYSSSDIAKKLLFGKDVIELLVKNPGPNAAQTIVGQERLMKAISYIPGMIKRQYITIPAVNEIVQNNKKNKSLRVVIGDVTSMDNFVYGEKTGACMRIGGAADSLFRFAMINDNGFHIRFEEPETGKFVSRVTCFRNGNTLFLNQLRDSANSNYSNEDLCEICTNVANIIIERSNNSQFPIENVVISGDFAMGNFALKFHRVCFDYVMDGYEPFYSDVKRGGYVLATSAKNEPYEKFRPGPNNAEKYPVLRRGVKVYTNMQEASERINQLIYINQLMNSESFGHIKPLKDMEIDFAVTGEDWYVYIDDNGNIHDKILDNLPDSKKEKAETELKAALEIIKLRLNDQKNQSISLQEVEMIETMGGNYGRK